MSVLDNLSNGKEFVEFNNSKKHVICHSPIACTGKEAAELVRIAKENKLILKGREHEARSRASRSYKKKGHTIPKRQ